MKKIKIFREHESDKIERDVNRWLEHHKNTIIHNITHCHTRDNSYIYEIMYTVMIVYEVEE